MSGETDEVIFEVVGTAEVNGKTMVGLTGSYVHQFTDEFYKAYKESGALNYLEISFTSKDDIPEKFIVTIQRAGGKTPHDFRLESDVALATAKASEERLREALRDLVQYVSAIEYNAPHPIMDKARAALEAP